MFRSAALTLTLCLATLTAQAALVSRLSGQAYYDTDLNITWVADANLAQTSGYVWDGQMNWTEAQAWIATLNSANYLGTKGWRLPKMTDTGNPGCDPAFTGSDCGFNVNLATGEMAHMYYSTLGNTAFYDANGVAADCGTPYNCMTNSGPFSKLVPWGYWYGTENAANPANGWAFAFDAGNQYDADKANNYYYGWAVRDGDIAAVPLPGGLWLLGTGLGVLGWRRRKLTA